MKRFKGVSRTALVSFGLALPALGLAAAPALADVPNQVYEIEAHLVYCSDGSTACAAPTPSAATNLRFALAEVYRLAPVPSSLALLNDRGVSLAPPDAALAKCSGPHYFDQKGNLHTTTMFAFVGPAADGLDQGTVNGRALLANASPTSTSAVGEASVTIYDAVSGDHATITGTQVTNNVTSSRVAGGFQISLQGPMYDEILFGPDASQKPTPLGRSGSMTCNTLGTPVNSGAPPTFEDSVDAPSAAR